MGLGVWGRGGRAAGPAEAIGVPGAEEEGGRAFAGSHSGNGDGTGAPVLSGASGTHRRPEPRGEALTLGTRPRLHLARTPAQDGLETLCGPALVGPTFSASRPPQPLWERGRLCPELPTLTSFFPNSPVENPGDTLKAWGGSEGVSPNLVAAGPLDPSSPV